MSTKKLMFLICHQRGPENSMDKGKKKRKKEWNGMEWTFNISIYEKN